MTWAESEAFLLDLPRFALDTAAYEPGMKRMETLLTALGEPHTRFRSVHVAGTNGKGSTASLVAAIATAAGLRTGLHTSPHLWDLAERMRIDGVAAPHDWLADAVTRYRADFETVRPSFFEATVALSFLYFAEMEVDLAVIEVGLGGRLDATNVLRPQVALVTHIGLDHVDLLGPTVEDVAREKAGIAKPGIPLLSAAEGGDVVAALRREATARGATFLDVREEVRTELLGAGNEGVVLDITTPVQAYRQLRVGLPGRHQAANAALAVRAAEHVVPSIQQDSAPVYRGLANVRKLSGLRARCEVVQRSPLIMADVAHNADGLRVALDWARGLVGGTLYVLYGTMRDKDLGAMANLLKRAEATVLPVGLPTARAVSQRALRRDLRLAGLDMIDVADSEAGLAWFQHHAAPSDGLLATGSHLTAARARLAS